MENSVELQASQYYIHRNYVPVYYYIYMELEDWISRNIFRNDTSRVFLASNEYAFRRRFELTDTSKDYHDIEASSLRFPFSNYWPLNSGWQPDQRVAGNQASMIYLGIYEGTTKVRAAGVVLNIPTTFYFDREDDARLAYDNLWFKSYNEHYYQMDVPYANNTLKLPFVIKLNGLGFNPQANEKDWLNKNRIFIISVNFEIRSYTIYPPDQPNYDSNIDAEGRYPDGTEYDPGYDNYYLTEEVILNFKNHLDLLTRQIKVNGTIEESEIYFDRLAIEDITETSATIRWKIKEEGESKVNISKIEIQVSNSNQQIALDPQSTEYTLENLNSGSIYNIFLTFYNDKGLSKKIGRSFSTLDSQSDVTEEEEPKNALVGLTW